MRVLVDATFPSTLERVPNASGVEIHRLTDLYSDSQLLDYAAGNGYAALVLLDQEMVARAEFKAMAQERGIILICSVSDDPFEAEANLRQAFPSIANMDVGPSLYWLRRDGLRAELEPEPRIG